MPHQHRRPWETHSEEPARKRPGRGSRGRGRVGPLRWISGLLAMGVLTFVFIVSLRGCSPAPDTTLITVGIEHQGDDGLPNPYASNDARALEQIDALHQTSTRPETLQELADSVSKVNSRKTDTLLIYINDLAGIDSKGGYFLESRDKFGTRLRFDVLWDALRGFPDAVPKVVILDLSRIQSDVWLGMLHNDVVAWLQDEMERAELENLYLLVSAAPDERSWISHELGRSVFGYYVADAFSNPAADTDGDRHLDLKELSRFVSEHTNQWVIQSRDRAGQHPRLLVSRGAADPAEIKLVRHPSDAVTFTGHEPSPVSAEKLDAILRAWTDTRNDSAIVYRNPYWRRASEFRLFDVDGRVRGISSPSGTKPGGDSPWHEVRAFDPKQVVGSRFLRMTLLNANDGSDEGPPLPETQLETIAELIDEQYGVDNLDPPGQERIRELAEFREYAENMLRGNWQAASQIKPLVVVADRYRREYEDLTFLQRYQEAAEAKTQAKSYYEAADRVAVAFRDGERAVAGAMGILPALSDWIATRENSHSANRQQRWDDSVRRKIVDFYREWFNQEGSMFVKADGQSEAELRRGLEQILSQVQDVSTSRIKRLDRAEVQILMLFHTTRELLPLLSSENRFSNSESKLLEEADDIVRRTMVHTRSLTDSVQELERELDDYANRLSEEAEAQSQTEQWREFADILRWPSMDRELRGRLVQQFQKITRNPPKVAVSTAAKQDDRSAEDVPRDVWAGNALWHALCAVHTITLTENPHRDKQQFDVLWLSWLETARFSDDPDHSDAEVRQRLRELGEAIGARFRSLGKRQNVTELPLDQLSVEQLRKHALSAYCRSGYDAGNSLYEDDPLTQWHMYRLADFSLFQAQRFREDYLAATAQQIRTPHWKGRHWYQFASETLLESAKQMQQSEGLGGNLRQELEEFQRLIADAAAPNFKVRPASSQVLDLGISLRDKAHFDFLNLPREVTGVASAWIAGNQSVLAFEPKSPQPVDIGTNDGKPLNWTIRVQKVPEESGGRELIPLNARLFFRGHLVKSEDPLRVNPYPPPANTFTLITSRPEDGRILLTGTEYRDLMVIFDCSRSMKEPGPGNQERIDTAWSVFRQFVNNMNVDNARKVGLLRYGYEWLLSGGQYYRRPDIDQAVPGRMSLIYSDMHFLSQNGSFEKPGQLNSAMMRGNIFQRLLLNKNLFDFAKEEDFPLAPWGSTPLYNAIDQGLKALQDENIMGGVLFVLTDGTSTEEEAEKQDMLNSISRRLQQMKSVTVWIIAFSNNVGLANLERDFDHFIKENPVLEGQMEYKKAKDGERLEEIFAELKEGTFTVSESPVTPSLDFDRGPHEVNSEIGASVPRFDGKYLVKYIYNKNQEMPVYIRGGERIVLKLEGGYLIKHEPYPSKTRTATDGVTTDRVTAPFQIQDDLDPRLAGYLPTRLVAESYQVKRQGDQIVAEFVISFDHGDETTPNWDATKTVLEPAEVEFELRATGASNAPVKLNWTQQFLEERSVPTWKLTATGLPDENLAFQLQAYWKQDKTPPGDQPRDWNELKEAQTVYIEVRSRLEPERQLLFPLLVKGTRVGQQYHLDIKADIDAFEADNPNERADAYLGEAGVLSGIRAELGAGDFTDSFEAYRGTARSTYRHAGRKSDLKIVFTIDEEPLAGQSLRVAITSRSARRDRANSLADWISPRRSSQ